jgi:hypothetical protein
MANAAQKKWMQTISSWYQGCGFIDHRLNQYQFQLHHAGGRAYKHNKVAIGHWFVLPLPVEYHDVNSNNPLNITHHKNKFTDEFGSQSELFQEMINSMSMLKMDIPFGCEVFESIMSTKK